ncbi:MAG: phage tail protein I [Pseudomonadota bacterium]|nr:phage tail protein I [Pseudomonadota bacterium]
MSNLLPPNSTKLEKALAKQADRITAIPVGIAALHHVDHCPVPYLPWLAWSLRVEFWDANGSEAQKRQAIWDGRTFNLSRGTANALHYALQQVTPTYQLLAWHQLTPKGMPFTFTVQLPQTQLYSINDIQTIHTAVNAAKSARDLYSVQARIFTDSTVAVAGAAREGQRVRLSTLD